MHPTITSLLRASLWRFIGRLGSDPEVRYFQSGAAVANARIAVNQPGAKRDDGLEPDWFKLEVWGADEARAFADTCRKGSLVDVSGRFKVETWTDRTGEERTGTTIRVESWQPVGQQQSPAAAAPRPAAPAPAPAAAAWASSNDDDGIPF
jgi:single-strand DNA-binding protein